VVNDPESRRQLSLYVPGNAAAELEAIRRVVDPVQSGLIPAHVTLCREDEIDRMSLADLEGSWSDGRLKPITLHFGRPEVFSGHGILLNCTAGQDEFQALREQVLGRTGIRTARPHITLAHPRNPKAPGNSLAVASGLRTSIPITFDAICLIEQIGGQPWQVLQSFALLGDDARSAGPTCP
jgi:2'-5' RNA ligase